MKRHLVLLILLSFFGFQNTTQAADEGRSEALHLYQEGLFQETGTGDLRMAEQVYRGIILRYRAHRDITAAAVYRLGAIHEKQGKTKTAISYFTMVIKKFPDQENLYQLAKTKLYALKKRVPRPKPTRSPTPRPTPIPTPIDPEEFFVDDEKPPLDFRLGMGVNFTGVHLRLISAQTLQMDLRFKSQDDETSLGLRMAYRHALTENDMSIQMVSGLGYAALLNPEEGSQYQFNGFVGFELPITHHLHLGADWGYYYMNQSHLNDRLVSTDSRGDIYITIYFQ